MSGSTSPDLDVMVHMWNMGRGERALAMLKGNPALVEQLKAEIARLEATGGQRSLLQHDEMSRQLYRVLKAIKEASELVRYSLPGVSDSETTAHYTNAALQSAEKIED